MCKIKKAPGEKKDKEGQENNSVTRDTQTLSHPCIIRAVDLALGGTREGATLVRML